ncbi:hypothetical protein NLI96_g1564 [Meripilus lineatus]|uniref:Endonuclease/exonuclease/phosphatase domain-containing protein n=1 Tax=Meripilus lineatus TaxID=2056292 RepID=A0AAD5YHD0_9APHY|nr:hypothetical protein NLI96_g1564 [Physisporinus lineatus]
MRATRSKRKLEEASSDHDDAEEAETQPEGRSTRSASPAEEEVKTQSTSRTGSKSQSQGSGSKRQLKRAKTEGSSSGVFENEQPTNTALPESIEFVGKNEGCLRIAAWNITSLASSQKKGFKRYVEAEDADILVLSETKVNNEPVDPSLTARYPHRYWAISAKKGYGTVYPRVTMKGDTTTDTDTCLAAGTAILSKRKALSVDYTLPGHPDPKYTKGRIITLEFEGSYLIGTYVPNAGVGLKTLDEKNLWNTHFEAYIRDLDEKKPVIWTGDLNVAPTELGE